MKAGFVITDKKLELPTYEGWVLNQGTENEIVDEKYIFFTYDSTTDFFGIANKVREERLGSYTTDKVSLLVYKKNENVKKDSFKELPIPKKQKELKDIGLLMCAFFNDDNARFDAIEKGIKQLKRLNPMPKIVFYETGKKPLLKHLFDKKDKYKFIKTTSKNEMLWQKEALFNLMAKENNFKYYIFHDPDIYPENEYWALWIKNYLKNNNVILQNGYVVSDTIVKDRSRKTYAYEISKTSELVIASPGGSIALRKTLFNKLKGWATHLIAGSGDGATISKWSKKFQYKNALLERCAWWKKEAEFERVSIGTYKFAPFILIHFNHGDYTKRGYYWRNIIIDWLGVNNIRNVVKIGSNGLLEWKKPRKDIIYALKNKFRLSSIESTIEVFKEAIVKEDL